jgi:hypothetical protein
VKKIKYSIILLLILTGSVFAEVAVDIPRPVEGRWVQIGSLVSGHHYAIAFFDVEWQERFFTAYEGITEKWVNVFNLNPITEPPVYLYHVDEGIISPVDSPWKWVPESI